MEKKTKKTVVDMANDLTEKPDLNPAVFGLPVRGDLLAQYVRIYLANQRAGNASVKTRGEVSGGGRKPWRQKGTGRARQGSIRAPHWVGGGVVHGPKPKDWSLKMSAKMKRAVLLSALSLRAKNNEVIIWAPSPTITKTKNFVKLMKDNKLSRNPLIIVGQKEKHLLRAGRNVPGLSLSSTLSLNPYAVIKSGQVVFSPESLNEAEKILASGH